MEYLEDDIEHLKMLRIFLKTTFRGSAFAGYQVDEGIEALGKLILHLERKSESYETIK